MAETVEAILGAVHIDGDDEALAAVIDRLGLQHELLAQGVTFPLSGPRSRQGHTAAATTKQAALTREKRSCDLQVAL